MKRSPKREPIHIFDYFVEYFFQGAAAQTVCVISDKKQSFPDFILMKRTLFSDFMRKIFPASHIVHFDDRKFCEDLILTGSDSPLIRAYFSEKVRDYFSSKKGNYYLEVHDNSVLFHRNESLKEGQISALLDETMKIIQHLKKNSL